MGDPGQFSNLLPISAIVAFLIVPLISFITAEAWSTAVKAVVAFVVCIGAAFLVMLYAVGVNWHDYRLIAITVFSSAISFYHLFWKPSGIAPSIRQNTGVKK